MLSCCTSAGTNVGGHYCLAHSASTQMKSNKWAMVSTPGFLSPSNNTTHPLSRLNQSINQTTQSINQASKQLNQSINKSIKQHHSPPELPPAHWSASYIRTAAATSSLLHHRTSSNCKASMPGKSAVQASARKKCCANMCKQVQVAAWDMVNTHIIKAVVIHTW